MIGRREGTTRGKREGTITVFAFLDNAKLDVRGEGAWRQPVRLHRQFVVIPERELSHAWNSRARKPHHVPMVGEQATHQ